MATSMQPNSMLLCFILAFDAKRAYFLFFSCFSVDSKVVLSRCDVLYNQPRFDLAVVSAPCEDAVRCAVLRRRWPSLPCPTLASLPMQEQTDAHDHSKRPFEVRCEFLFG